MSHVLIGDIDDSGIFHVLSWSSRKSRRFVKSSGSTEILACGDAINEGKSVADGLRVLLNKEVPFIVAVDSKDLFNALCTLRNAADKSIRVDINVIRYELETQKVHKMVWIPV